MSCTQGTALHVFSFFLPVAPLRDLLDRSTFQGQERQQLATWKSFGGPLGRPTCCSLRIRDHNQDLSPATLHTQTCSPIFRRAASTANSRSLTYLPYIPLCDSDKARDMDHRTVWQPIHHSLRPYLDPEYVLFHDQHMQYVVPDDAKVWDGTARTHPSLPPGGSIPIKVGRIQDVQLATCKVRVFVPDDNMGEPKYPALLWFHGGEDPLASIICNVLTIRRLGNRGVGQRE